MEFMCGMVRLEGVVGMGSQKRAEEKQTRDFQVITCWKAGNSGGGGRVKNEV